MIYDTMSLGDMIDALELADRDAYIEFDFCGANPTKVDSYRGYYDHLAIGWEERGVTKVRDVLDDLREAVGKTFEGYKGGDYRMDRDTPVWVSNYGRCDSTVIDRIEDREGIVIIHTKKSEGY